MSSGAADPALQLQGRWTLTKIADAAAPNDALMTVTANQIEIFIGCNTISATAMYAATFAGFRDIKTTKMSCAPNIQALEMQLIDALERSKSLQVGKGDALSLYDEMNSLQLGAVRISSQP